MGGESSQEKEALGSPIATLFYDKKGGMAVAENEAATPLGFLRPSIPSHRIGSVTVDRTPARTMVHSML